MTNKCAVDIVVELVITTQRYTDPLVGWYPIIEQITQHLSALDLYRLATACTELYAMVPFNKCDGKGLLARQNFEGIYKLAQMKMRHRNHKLRPVYDEELEVRVWNLKCDAMNALPCVKCGIYVCEVCTPAFTLSFIDVVADFQRF
ncbi:hypothetical protein HYFRA_00013113 [Hymenoscyphus fraxineus]|uniref:F-box domain-containing protein n=1 Tax=Hymenoscyphus fraxineus TaxID=746836 RepID=A0A9N9L8A3_9HELO|nr:hypothetical protein HYFRA_00013113 [Hymenoscyphus fraxineus]